MTSRELVRRTLEFRPSPAVPRHIRVLPWAEQHYPDEISRLRAAYPDDIVTAPFAVGDGDDLARRASPSARRSLDRDAVNRFCRGTDKFVLAGTVIRPFERLTLIRTMEQALADLQLQPPVLFELLHSIHQQYLDAVDAWARTEVDAIVLMDDWGSQTRMLAAPEMVRRLFKPLYRDYCEIARRHHKYVFMHSDGHVLDIIPDLVEIGVDALNLQVRCMGAGALGSRFRGLLTFWGDVGDHDLLTSGSREDIRRSARDLYRCLYADGGVIAQCEVGPGARPGNVFELLGAWDELGRGPA